MAISADPADPAYLDEADTRATLTMAFDICQSCRRCVDLCASFPTLFELLDRHDDRDAGRLTPAEQDHVVGDCHQCNLCSLDCPFGPGRHEHSLDVPRLMVRASAMQRENNLTSTRSSIVNVAMNRASRLGSLTSPIANSLSASEPDSKLRRVAAKLVGISSVRMLPPHAKERFTTWFARRPKISLGKRQGRVTIYPTCLVEYHETQIGMDLVQVYEHNGIECDVTNAGCCGAPWLHSGDVQHFTKLARANVTTLAAEVRSGSDVVLPQATCGHVVKHEYPHYLAGTDAHDDALLVAEHAFDAAEYLVKIHRADDTWLDTDFHGDVPGAITYHAPCHLRAQGNAMAGRDVLKLTGAHVTVVQHCSGTAGTRGLRTDHEDASLATAAQLGSKIDNAAGDAIAGSCHLANTAITEQTGIVAQHPLQILARAYGLHPGPELL